ncbi:MAG: hypothetical protein WCI75_14680, partial [candidate division NC10 bacterium]
MPFFMCPPPGFTSVRMQFGVTSLPVPAVVVRGYGLPAWVGPDVLVVAVSYSGDTEETLACAAEALERGRTPVC